MAAPIVLIGTGTSVGKTYVAERLLRALGDEGVRACGYKPVESGVTPFALESTDAERLAGATPFHVKPPLARFVFERPVSAHLAARDAGTTIDLERIRLEVTRARQLVELLVVELPGGAFSPLTDTVFAADFARSIPDARTLLVATDRLGVLHDVLATIRACASIGLPIYGIVLSAPATPDLSTGTNARELASLTRIPILAVLQRADADAPRANADPIRALARSLAP